MLVGQRFEKEEAFDQEVWVPVCIADVFLICNQFDFLRFAPGIELKVSEGARLLLLGPRRYLFGGLRLGIVNSLSLKCIP